MSEPPEEQLPHLDAAEEERVRRLLAGAGPEPLPADVATRLDDTLAALARERRERREAGQAPSTERLPVEPARTRRRWPMVLVAAAAVCLIALGAGDLVRSGVDSGGASSAGQAASQAKPGAAGAADGREALVAAPPLPRLHTPTLSADVARAARQHADGRLDATAGPAAVRCAAPPHSPGDRVLLVRLDGDPASLVLGPVTDGHRAARLYPCEAPGAPLVSLTVPAR